MIIKINVEDLDHKHVVNLHLYIMSHLTLEPVSCDYHQ